MSEGKAVVLRVEVRNVLNKHRKRDEWFLDDYSVNPYRGCEYGCAYCYIYGSRYGRGTGEVAAKVNAPRVLARELERRARRREYGFIALASATEPWMGAEEKFLLTRKCLEAILRYRFPVHCLTKSKLIVRDVDLLKEIDGSAILPADLRAKLGRGVLITVSLSTLDKEIAGVFEPNAPSPDGRLKLVEELKGEGFMVGIAYMPLLPFISDSEESLLSMAKEARDAGADYVFFYHLTLYGEGKERFMKVIRRRFPELAEKYEKLYSSGW